MYALRMSEQRKLRTNNVHGITVEINEDWGLGVEMLIFFTLLPSESERVKSLRIGKKTRLKVTSGASESDP